MLNNLTDLFLLTFLKSFYFFLLGQYLKLRIGETDIQCCYFGIFLLDHFLNPLLLINFPLQFFNNRQQFSIFFIQSYILAINFDQISLHIH